MTSKLQLEEVWANGAYRDDLVHHCVACRDPVLVHSAQGKRFIRDQLCSDCFRAICRFAVKNGDMRKVPKLLSWPGRTSATWHTIRDAYLLGIGRIYQCKLCGQVIRDEKPCGCGARGCQ